MSHLRGLVTNYQEQRRDAAEQALPLSRRAWFGAIAKQAQSSSDVGGQQHDTSTSANPLTRSGSSLMSAVLRVQESHDLRSQATVETQTDDDAPKADTSGATSDATAADAALDEALELISALDAAGSSGKVAPTRRRRRMLTGHGALGRVLSSLCSRLTRRCRRRTRGMKTSEAREALSWALGWMTREYPADFRNCMRIIAGQAVFMGAAPLVSDRLLNAVIPNFQDGVTLCVIDLALYSTLLVIGQVQQHSTLSPHAARLVRCSILVRLESHRPLSYPLDPHASARLRRLCTSTQPTG